MDALAQLNSSLTGRYAIDREIGRGGMATVFLARDVRHSRNVALKVLNPELGAVLGIERFLSEIQVTAKLQHPNLLPLFDSGEAEGLLFYVMPFIEGESLRRRLMREKQLPIEEALHIASAVAGALDYAHRHGVIHRDLKPENILLSESQPLVADFGIALAVSKAGGERITQTGVSLGTPHYMSPEQATGDRAIDGRTDIYALGAVLYEMLTGDPPHTASTAQAVIAKVLTDTPRDVRVMRPHVPAHVAAAVACALEKLPADRFPTAQAFVDALAGRAGGVAIPTGVHTPGSFRAFGSRAGWRRVFNARVVVMVAAAFVAGSAAGGVGVARYDRRAADAAPLSFVIQSPATDGVPESIENVAVAPDGRTVAFIARSGTNSRAYVRRFADVESRPLPGISDAFDVAFSPNGNWLAVLTYGGRLLKVAIDGSSTLTLTQGLRFWGSLDWENDRSILIGTAGPTRGLSRVSADGGVPRQLTTAKPAWQHGKPFAAPDGKTLLFLDWGPGYTEDDFIAIGSLETGAYSTTTVCAVAILGVVNDRIIYVSTGGAVMAARFDRRKQQLIGEPLRLSEGIAVAHNGNGTAALSSGGGGTFLYKRGQLVQRLVVADSTGDTRPLSEEERDFGPLWGWPSYSPDGRRIAVNVFATRGDTSTTDVWIFDTSNRTFSRLTSIGNVLTPRWTPDGRYLLFITWQMDHPTLWRQTPDGSRPAEPLLRLPDGNRIVSESATPDGRGALYCHWMGESSGLFYLPFDGDRKPERIVPDRLPGFTCEGRVSPDGRWLAYVTADGGGTNVSVRPFRGGGRRVDISSDGGDSPVWSRDGTRLYYRHTEQDYGSGALFVADVRSTQDGLEVTRRRRLMTLGAGGVYDVAPDGKHFLTLQQNNTRVQLVVTTNWLAQLRARLAGQN